ncbi:MAG: hypothetical protein CMH54_07185 [Myxococcales bacterium]|nr:hypothetical protein [Myxococcales bacterium]
MGRISLYLWWTVLILVAFTACKSQPVPTQPEPDTSSSKEPVKPPAQSNQQTLRVRQGDVVRTLNLESKPTEDGCQMDVAQRVLRTRKSQVTACAQKAAQRLGRIPAGRIVISLALDKKGDAIKRVVSLNETGDATLGACIVDVLDLNFPNPFGKQCIIQAPYLFGEPQNKP